MGGLSDAEATLDNGVAFFTGHVNIVLSFQTLWFFTMVNRDGVDSEVSSCNALMIMLKAQDTYSDYYVSFGSV